MMATGAALAPAPVVPAATLGARLRVLLSFAGRGDRLLFAFAVACVVATAAAGSVQAFALGKLVDAAFSQRQWTGVVSAAGVAFVAAGTQVALGRAFVDLSTVLSFRVGTVVDEETMRMSAGAPGIEHLERADYLDQMAVVRQSGTQAVQALFSLMDLAGVGLRVALAVAVLAAVHPALVTLPLFAVPALWLAPRASRRIEDAKNRAAERRRAAMQLHARFLDRNAAMEMRLASSTGALDARADQLFREVGAIDLSGALGAAGLSSIGWAILAAGYVLALSIVAFDVRGGGATPGDALLVSHLALQLRNNIVAAAYGAQRWTSALSLADRYLWLGDIVRRQTARFTGTARPPASIRKGITFEGVCFSYPDSTQLALDDVSVHLPAGSVVAVVGENGAGKTSLVKLLCGLYLPSAGRILVDDVDLATIEVYGWRTRLSGTFQDYARLETSARSSIGVGNMPDLDDDARILEAAARAEAAALVASWPDGLDTHLGKSYRSGLELSGGQWQRVAIARAFMRSSPLLLVLDEPTAALDPDAEHALYNRYAHAAVGAREAGGITVLVSHRFSSVRMADLIVVLEGGRVSEVGSHDELVARGGTYARLFRRQKAAYE